MKISSATFVKGITGEDEILHDGRPHVAIIGRSNVGKSSVINSLTHKGLAKTSSFPGRTQQINIFLINKDFYLVDLPGYGYAKGSKDMQEQLQQLIYWYLLNPEFMPKKVIVVIDANIGPTDNDLQMIHSLEQQGKNIIVVANKVDKIKKSEYKNQLKKIQDSLEDLAVIPYSAENKIGTADLLAQI